MLTKLDSQQTNLQSYPVTVDKTSQSSAIDMHNSLLISDNKIDSNGCLITNVLEKKKRNRMKTNKTTSEYNLRPTSRRLANIQNPRYHQATHASTSNSVSDGLFINNLDKVYTSKNQLIETHTFESKEVNHPSAHIERIARHQIVTHDSRSATILVTNEIGRTIGNGDTDRNCGIDPNYATGSFGQIKERIPLLKPNKTQIMKLKTDDTVNSVIEFKPNNKLGSHDSKLANTLNLTTDQSLASESTTLIGPLADNETITVENPVDDTRSMASKKRKSVLTRSKGSLNFHSLRAALQSESTVKKGVQETMRNSPKTSCSLPAVESVNTAMSINQIADGIQMNETSIKKDNEVTQIKTHRYDLRKMTKRTKESANEQSNNQIGIDVKVKQLHMADQYSHNDRNANENPAIKRNDNITGTGNLMNTITDDVYSKFEKRSSIYDHIKETRHTIDWENAKIIWTDSIPSSGGARNFD